MLSDGNSTPDADASGLVQSVRGSARGQALPDEPQLACQDGECNRLIATAIHGCCVISARPEVTWAGPAGSQLWEYAMKLKTLARLILIALAASLSHAAHAQTFSVIHAFTGSGADGAFPGPGVTLREGALYGTAAGEGNVVDSVYEITRVESDWSLVPIFHFSDNGGATGRVVLGQDGHLYGTDTRGNCHYCYYGSIFNLIPPLSTCKTAACFWTENALHNFEGPPTDGENPGYGDLITDTAGNIYGTTISGGTTGHGTVFEFNLTINSYEVIYNFLGDSDGDAPPDGVIADSKGNLYGTSHYGGLYNFGTVFGLAYVAGVGWQKTVLYPFKGGSDGGEPVAGLIMDSSGNLYGATTIYGVGGIGTVFELVRSGNTYAFKLLYSFSGHDRCGPRASLAMDGSGNLYGTTYCGGENRLGNIFELANTPNGWVYTSLHDFTGGNDGGVPFSKVTIDADGTLYGTASQGGNLTCYPPTGCGVVWMIKP